MTDEERAEREKNRNKYDSVDSMSEFAKWYNKQEGLKQGIYLGKYPTLKVCIELQIYRLQFSKNYSVVSLPICF